MAFSNTQPATHGEKVTYFAETDARNRRVPFGIKSKDRSRHMYVIGKTGMGKSTLLENMAVQDINNGEGFAFIDPHGKTAELLLDYVPQERINDVLYFAPFDLEYPVSFNVMEDVGYEKRHLVANGLMSAFKKIWVDAWSARMEYILNNIILALLEYPDSTLLGVNRMLADKEYRKKVVENVTDPAVKSFWVDEFAKYGERYMQEAGAAIQNKIGQFVSNPVIRNIIGQPKSSFDIRKIMDEKKIVIINLSKGRVGEANANLLGSMLITKIYLGAMSRADVSPSVLDSLPDFHLYVDEFQSFANESFADILSEARKYKLSLVVAHQYIEQMSDEVRAAVFGNVGTMIVFRVGAYDAEVLEKEFNPYFTAEDLVNLGFVQIYLKLMIDGVSSQPFSATTLPPISKPTVTFKEDIVSSSRSQFARSRGEVENDIRVWHNPIESGDSERKRVSRQDRQSDNNQPRKQEFSKHRGDGGGKDNNRSMRETSERELRSAISNNYLKDAREEDERKRRREEDEKKKRSKVPSTENLSALRDALSTVLKDATPTITSKPAKKEVSNVVPPLQEVKKSESQHVAPVLKENAQQPPKGKKEVSEEELRKILSVEE